VKDPLVAELAYREAAAARDRVRAIQRAITLPLRLLATADLVGAVAAMVIGQYHLLSYFAPAYGLVLVGSGWWYRRYAARHGMQLPVRPWVLILVATLTVGATMSRLGVALDEQWVSDFGPCLAFAVGTGITAAWLGSTRLALTAIAMVASTAVVSLAAEGDLAVALQLAAFGILLWLASLDTSDHQHSDHQDRP
jgi:hypothetical protein